MANAADPLYCECQRNKPVALFCKRHLQTLCNECLLSDHKECIEDIITIEEATKKACSLWDGVLSKCDTYKQIYERHKTTKDDIYKKMDAMRQQLRVTISQMRHEMKQRIDQVCKNALELSVSVMSQRIAVAKTDVENLEKAMTSINSIQTTAAKKTTGNETNCDFISDLEEAKKKLDALDKQFEHIEQNRSKVTIQFVVSSIVTDFMEQLHSLGEIVEEVKEEDRTSFDSSQDEKVDMPNKEPLKTSRNPFKLIRTSVDKSLLGVDNSEAELFIFHKGLYNQEDRQYDYIGVRRLTNPKVSETSKSKSHSCIPPLPCRKISCPNRPDFPGEINRAESRGRKISCPTRTTTPRSSTGSGYELTKTVEQEDVDTTENNVNTESDTPPPIPTPRTTIGKTAQPDIIITPPHLDDFGNNQPQTFNSLQRLRRNLKKTNSNLSTSSNESNTTHSSREDRTDSGIIVHLEEKTERAKHFSSSSTSTSPSMTPVLHKKGLQFISSGSLVNKFETAYDTSHPKNSYLKGNLKVSKQVGHFRFPSWDSKGISNKTTVKHQNNPFSNSESYSDSDIDATKAMEILDFNTEPDSSDHDSIEDFAMPVQQTSGAPASTLTVLELYKHKQDIKDICIISSIVVTESQLIIVCDFPHNLVQMYDRLGNRITWYKLGKPFGSCLLSENRIAVTSRIRNSISIFNVSTGLILEREHRLENLVDPYGLSYSNGYICVCCLTHVILFMEDLRPYRTVKAFNGMKSKGTLMRKKSAKPVFSGAKYCHLDFTSSHMEIIVSDCKQDRVVCMNVDGDVKWVQTVKAPKSVVLHQGKIYVAAKKHITVIEAVRGQILREIHDGVPKHPWGLFIDEITSSVFITNGSVNDKECRQIQSLPLKILTTILG